MISRVRVLPLPCWHFTVRSTTDKWYFGCIFGNIFYIIKNVVCTTNQCTTFRGVMISPANICSVLQSSFIVYGIIVVFIAFFVLHTIKVRKECKKLVFTLQCIRINRITHVNLTFLKHNQTTLCILTQLKNFKSKNGILRWNFS